MTKNEALKMAIEALEECLDDLQGWAAYASDYFQDKWDLDGEVKAYKDKIQACKEALEQPLMTYEQGFDHGYEAHGAEQMADACKEQPVQDLNYDELLSQRNFFQDIAGKYASELYDLQSVQEPVALVCCEHELDDKVVHAVVIEGKQCPPINTPLYTHPAPSWQGLSDDELTDLLKFMKEQKRVEL